MDKIIKILSREENQEKIKFKKQLKCNDVEFEILLLILNSYLNNQIIDYTINNILQDYNYYKNNKENEINEIDFEDNLKSLLYLKNIENLISLGWLKTDVDYENKNTFNKLNSHIEIDKNLFNLLENGDFQKININITPYNNVNDYLEDYFKLIEFVYEKEVVFPNNINKKSPKYIYIEENIKKIKDVIDKKINITKIFMPLENFKKTNQINEDVFYILLIVLKETLIKNENIEKSMNEENILKNMLKDKSKIINLSEILETLKYNNENIVYSKEYFKDSFYNPSKLKKFYYLNKSFLDYVIPNNMDFKTDSEILESKLNINNKDNLFELIKSDKNINNLVVSKEIKNLINILKKQNDDEVKQRLIEWGVKNVDDDISERILFFGNSGTGKTLTSIVIANELNKSILTFDCSKVFSMYVGESEKNIKKIFTNYNQIIKEMKNPPILVLNEADQLFSNRIENTSSSSEKHFNNVQNLLLEEIEKFSGILICTTNMIKSFDKAFSRRFDYKIEFKLPNENERLEIWKKLLPKTAKYEENFDITKLSNYKLSGGQIEMIIRNTSKKIAIKNEKNLIFTYKDFKEEIEKEIDMDLNKEKTVGFCK